MQKKFVLIVCSPSWRLGYNNCKVQTFYSEVDQSVHGLVPQSSYRLVVQISYF